MGIAGRHDHAEPHGHTGHGHAGQHDHKWAQYAREQLRRAGHNRGASRDAMIEVFAGEGCACSAREIEELANRERLDRKPVGRSSIYRAIEELHDLGLITRVDLGDGVTRYEAVRPDDDHHHHHILCEQCGALIPFDDAELERAIGAIAGRHGFVVKEHDVTLRGVCWQCERTS
jgi:Fur family transcriptional regulator, ferric uptake regulator